MHRHSASPAGAAHGHGLAASTSWNRAGYRATPPDRAIATSPLSSGCRSASSTPAWNSGASSRNSTPRCASERARAGPAASRRRPARPTRPSGAAPGTAGAVPAARPRQQPGDRVHRGHLERLLVVQRRQHPGQPLGQHRLARAGRPGAGQVVPAGRGHLDRAPARRLPDHVGAGPGRGAGRGRGRAHRPGHQPVRPPRRIATRSASVRHPAAPPARAPAPPRPGSPPARRPGAIPAPGRPSTAGSTPRIGRSRPSRPSSPSSTSRRRALAPAPRRRRRARRPPARGRSRAPRFGSVAGDSAERDPPVRPALAGVQDRRPDPVPGLLIAASGRPIIVTPGSPSARSASISTSVPRRPRPARPTSVRASVIRTPPRRCPTSGPAPRRRDEHADHVEAQVRRRAVVRGQPALAEPAHPGRFAAVTASAGCAEARAAAGLHLAEDQRVAVRGDDVELALGAPPVAVERSAARRRSGAGPPPPRRSDRSRP